jgi:hypothetical protein
MRTEPCPGCGSPVYRRVVDGDVVVLFNARLTYDGVYYYSRRHRHVR